MQPFILLVHHKSCVLYAATGVCEVSMETVKELKTPPSGAEYVGLTSFASLFTSSLRTNSRSETVRAVKTDVTSEETTPLDSDLQLRATVKVSEGSQPPSRVAFLSSGLLETLDSQQKRPWSFSPCFLCSKRPVGCWTVARWALTSWRRLSVWATSGRQLYPSPPPCVSLTLARSSEL